MAFFDDIRQRVNRAAQSVSNKTKENVEISRISGEIKSIEGELESLFMQIGRAYVESKGEAGEALSALCERADELRGRLEALEKQKFQVRNQNICPVCGNVMPKDARFCSNCGGKMPEPEPEPEPEEEPVEDAVPVEKPESEAEPIEAEPVEPEPEAEDAEPEPERSEGE